MGIRLPDVHRVVPHHLRASGVGASVAVGRIGAIVGAVVLAQTASIFGIWSAFLTLAALWSIGAIAAGVSWLRGIEARGMSLEALGRALAGVAR